MWILACGINRHSCCVYSPCYNRRLDFFFNTQAAVTFFNLLDHSVKFYSCLNVLIQFFMRISPIFFIVDERIQSSAIFIIHIFAWIYISVKTEVGLTVTTIWMSETKKQLWLLFLCLKGQKLESKISRKFGDYWQLSEFFTSFSASSSLSSVAIFFGLLWWLRLWRLYPLLFPDHFHALQWICTVFWIMILICINVVEAYILHWPFYILQRLLLLRCCDKSMNCYLFHYCGMLPNV